MVWVRSVSAPDLPLLVASMGDPVHNNRDHLLRFNRDHLDRIQHNRLVLVHAIVDSFGLGSGRRPFSVFRLQQLSSTVSSTQRRPAMGAGTWRNRSRLLQRCWRMAAPFRGR